MRRMIRVRSSSKLRPIVPQVDRLEARELLSTTPGPISPTASAALLAGLVARPMFEVRPFLGGPPTGDYTPLQIEQAYNFNQIMFGTVPGNGAGETIAIVDAQDDPNIQADLNTFDTQFSLPSITVTRVNETGGSNLPASDPTGGWELEESLDVEWAHAIAPGANIVLVEASSANGSDLLTAIGYAATHANVVSMSWGGSEFSGENTYDSSFAQAGVVFVASSGDSGAPASWPATSPNVLAVGGTALTLTASNNWSSESGWSGSTGGPSTYESQPSYQTGVVTQTSTQRADPDVAYDGSPSTGFAVYDSVPYNGTTYDWLGVGGTSAGAPQWSALLAIADQGRALSSQPAINSASPQQVMTTLYAGMSRTDFHDITTGSSTGSPSYSAGPGYDYVTGLGTPIANLVVQSLDGNVTQPTTDHLVLTAAAIETAGTPISLTVTADMPSGRTDTGYLGTIRFSSSDVQAGLPASYTFTAANAGSHTFSITLKSAGAQTVTTSDASNAGITGSTGITVSPAAASQLILTGLSSAATVATPLTFTITAKDPFGNVATAYAGSIHFTSSDTLAVLPASYTFTSNDHGAHSFAVTFDTAGSQSLTATDSSGLTVTQSGITVAPAAPINLTAATSLSTQINLSWMAAAGATGYNIQRSPNGATGWTQISTTAGNTTTYQNTGLSAGTTYYYRVQATGGGVNSAFSNTAGATTTGTSSSGSDTLWSNSYTPPENAYSWGSYEVGVKFTASVAGSVTGLRFYKQTWMGGYQHIGHLWTSTGQLLATAMFSSETSYGWQQVNLSSPVSLSPNTVYIMSFSTGGGYFGITTGFFSSGGVTSGPLQALPNSTSGGDGVYHYGTGTFPNTNGGGMNFWVDIAFAPATIGGNHAHVTLPVTGHSDGAFVYITVVTPPALAAGSSTRSHASAVQRTVTALTPTWSYRGTVTQVGSRLNDPYGPFGF